MTGKITQSLKRVFVFFCFGSDYREDKITFRSDYGEDKIISV